MLRFISPESACNCLKSIYLKISIINTAAFYPNYKRLVPVQITRALAFVTGCNLVLTIIHGIGKSSIRLYLQNSIIFSFYASWHDLHQVIVRNTLLIFMLITPTYNDITNIRMAHMKLPIFDAGFGRKRSSFLDCFIWHVECRNISSNKIHKMREM